MYIPLWLLIVLAVIVWNMGKSSGKRECERVGEHAEEDDDGGSFMP